MDIMVYVLEMLYAGLLDTDFADSHTEGVHQVDGIRVSTVGRSESRHGDTDNTLTGPSQLIESLYANQQRQRRIQSTRNADNGTLRFSMHQTLRQSGHLDGEYLLTAFVQRYPLRNKWMRFKSTCQVQIPAVDILRRDSYRKGRNTICMASREGRIHPALRTQVFHINFTDDHLPFEREAFVCRQQSPVLINQSVAGKHHIRSGFSETA